MTLRLARTSAEAYLYMGLTPCDICGETDFVPVGGPVLVAGVLASQYAGRCGHCGVPREFRFRLPEEIAHFAAESPRFGGDEPSELLDAGQWLGLADRIGAATPAVPPSDLDLRHEAWIDLRSAAAAVDEVLKFIPPGADSVPATALWSDAGRAFYARDPTRFARMELHQLRRRYLGLADSFRPSGAEATS